MAKGKKHGLKIKSVSEHEGKRRGKRRGKKAHKGHKK